jgi:hypothetical protein
MVGHDEKLCRFLKAMNALGEFAGGFFEEFVDEDGRKTRWKVARPDRIGMQTAQLEGWKVWGGCQKAGAPAARLRWACLGWAGCVAQRSGNGEELDGSFEAPIGRLAFPGGWTVR